MKTFFNVFIRDRTIFEKGCMGLLLFWAINVMITFKKFHFISTLNFEPFILLNQGRVSQKKFPAFNSNYSANIGPNNAFEILRCTIT